MALALGEDRDQHVGAGDLLAAGRLHMDHRALHHALEAGGRLGVLGAVGNEVLELGLEIVDEAAAQLVEIDAAGSHHRGGVLVVDQRQQQVLERRILVMPLVRDGQRAMQGLFKALRESRHSRPLWPPPYHSQFDRWSSVRLRSRPAAVTSSAATSPAAAKLSHVISSAS